MDYTYITIQGKKILHRDIYLVVPENYKSLRIIYNNGNSELFTFSTMNERCEYYKQVCIELNTYCYDIMEQDS